MTDPRPHPAAPPTADRWTARLRRSGPPGRLGWRRTVLLRRLAAAVLATAALVLALTPADRTAAVPVLVAATDLAAGGPVRAADLAVRHWPAELVPGGALHDPAAVDGRTLVGGARAGEPITDARLAGASRVSTPDGAVVPVRLADAGVAAVLAPGSRVDVVAPGERADQPLVLAADATVQAVLEPDPGAGPVPGSGDRLVLITMSRTSAGRVAATSLNQSVAVTLR
jgi:pilus assembly protein CpaB